MNKWWAKELGDQFLNMEIFIENIKQYTSKDGETTIFASISAPYLEFLVYLSRLHSSFAETQTAGKRIQEIIRIIPPDGEPIETTGGVMTLRAEPEKALIVLHIKDVDLAPIGSRLEFRYELINHRL